MEEIYEVEVDETPIEEEVMEDKTFGDWLKECPVGKKSKKRKKGRIAAAVGLTVALVGGATIAILSKLGGGDVEVPELTEGIDPDAIPLDTDVDVADVVETVTE